MIPREHIKHFLRSASWQELFYNVTQHLDLQRKVHIYQFGIKTKPFSSGVRRPARPPSKFSKYLGIQLCLLLVKINTGLKLKAVPWKCTYHYNISNTRSHSGQAARVPPPARPASILPRVLTRTCAASRFESQLLHFKPFKWYCIFSLGKENFLYLRDI